MRLRAPAAEVRALRRLRGAQGCGRELAWLQTAGACYRRPAAARRERAGKRPATRRSRMPGSRVAAAAVPAEPPAAADRCPCPGLGMAAESGARAGRGRAVAPVAGNSPRRASGGRPWWLADSQRTPRVSASGFSWAGDPGTVQSLRLKPGRGRANRIRSLSHPGLPDFLSSARTHGSSCRPRKNLTAQGFAGFRSVPRSAAISYTKRRDRHAPCLSLAE